MRPVQEPTTTTQFDDVRQFLGAIERARPYVRQGLVRVARLHNEGVGDNAARLNVVAAARTHDQAILMDVACGALTGDPRRDGPVLARANALTSQIERRCAQIGLQVRPGVISA